MRKIQLTVLFLFALPLAGLAQIVPDIEGFRTLKCDLHMHTVYSDGLVWPTFRVREALFAGRSIALSAGDVMAGPETLTRAFVMACMEIDTSGTAATIVNRSGIAYILSDSGGNEFVLPPLGSLYLPAFTGTGWTVLNVYTGKDRHLQLGSGK